ncbi:NAD-dependent epimerase/dehydratase family protein [Edaphobacter dinghuensis]|uniref:NAD-dependent epimerase/dehydratase domain-containing protein n=1 Tax=Edaphobacter dinghuensis TaxID=1560005 RepID=A0A917MA06_9BACT|nr:NAD-dependent epimerase/dehydratase family protein [Edaphobacter dinghuensis]GGG87043.1 hypothetical protein GCM10011585_33820 [Edaphobacter dinghuensis]
MNRRHFIEKSFIAGGAAVATLTLSRSAFATIPRKILVLGGTSFLGPAIVEAALIGGHEVTLFNRGRTHPELFPQLEKLRGFRALDERVQNLKSLEGRRRWDAIIDVWPCEPTLVASAATLLHDRTGHYLYVSSVGAYASYDRPNMNEEAPTRAFDGNEEDYSPAKAESERRLKAIVGNRLTIVRPNAIHGTRDVSPDILSWLLRAQRGGMHIGPGDGNDYAEETVDVKDVARFLVMSIERQMMGTFNLTGHPTTFRDYLASCNEVTDSDAQWIWIPKGFLVKQGIADWNHFLGWNTDPSDWGFNQISSQKALDAGWRPRPFRETALDILAYYRSPNSRIVDWRHPQIPWQDPLTPEKEQEVLSAWKSTSA